jgi:cytochrome P450
MEIPMPTVTLPPGPRQSFPGANLLRFSGDPIRFLTDLNRRYGDVATFKIGPQRMVLLNHPDLIREVLVTNSRNFVKGRTLERAKRVLGEGLLTSEGEFHLRQRRLSQPTFHRQRVAGYGATMVRCAEEHAAAWRPGQELDMQAELLRLTLRIVGFTLFDTDTAADADDVGVALHDLIAMFGLITSPLADLIERLPLPQVRRIQQARERLDAIMYRLIAERRASGEDRGDLLSMLMLAQDAEGGGGGMSDLQVRDEALTIFLAGHETTASALSWTFYLLARHPEVAERLGAELDAALGGRAPTMADLPRLSYAEMVFAEAMRLYPPAWVIGRRALGLCELGGYSLPANTTVLMSQWVMHHDPRYFPDPTRFDPERFRPEAKASRPKFSYFPFGGGPRTCIGEPFAWMEGTLLLASLARRWRPQLSVGQVVLPKPGITLRPHRGLPMRLAEA